MSEERPRPKMFDALKVRDFALLWSGQGVSAIGDGIFSVALVIETLHVDHSPTGLAYVIAARAVPSVGFSLLGGVIVDRLPRRFTMLGADVVRGLAVGVIALLVALGHIDLLSLIAMSIVFGSADAFFGPASMSMVPELLPTELLVQGNALSSTTSNLASSLLGPATGGAVIGLVGLSGSFTADAGSFAFSAACLLLMAGRPRPESRGTSKLAEAKEGLLYVTSRRWLLGTLIAASAANFFGIAPFAVLLPLLVRHQLKASPLALGLVFAVGGAAGVIASLIVAKLGSPKNRILVMWVAYAFAGVAIACMAAAPDVVLVGALSAVEIGLIVYGDVLYVSMMQQLVPQELRGRVFSAAYLLAFVLTPLGTVVGGFAAASLGTRTAVLLSGCLSAVCCLVFVFPSVRNPQEAAALR
jgi:MFS family permease